MKKSQITPAVMAGNLLIVAEYRSFKVETITYRDKKTGNMLTRFIAKHSCEAGDSQFQVAEFLPDDYSHDKNPMSRPFPKGQSVVVLVESFTQEKGFISVSGDMQALEDDEPAQSSPSAKRSAG